MLDNPDRVQEAEELLAMLHEAGVVTWNTDPVTLKNGSLSHVYVQGRNDITERPSLLRWLGQYIAETTVGILGPDDFRKIILIGIPTAGTPLAIAAAIEGDAGIRRDGFGSRMMRSVPKSHGVNQSWIDGNANPAEEAYFLIDNVVTDGASKFETNKRLALNGYPEADLQHLVLINRGDEVLKSLNDQGLSIYALFDLLDIVEAFGRLRLWTKPQVRAVQEEVILLSRRVS